MLYKRSSFITWLQAVKDCDIVVIGNDTKGGALLIKNGSCKTYMGTDPKDLIDYEEIYLVCNKLYIDGLPGNSDLIIVE